MIPILFKEDETNFNSNGIGHLKETITYDVREVRNGEFELYLEYPVTGKWFNEIKDFRFILAEPNEVDDDHLFRIYETIKDADKQTIFVYAATKSNDLGGNLVNNVIITNETAQQAMTKIKQNLIMPTDYNFVSDIQTKSSTDWLRRNPLNCIAGEEGSLVNYWGGEIKRTNDTIYLYSRRGKDRVTTIRQGKNLEGFNLTSSTKGMITRILPFFTYTPEKSDKPVTITGPVVDSPLVNNYPVKYITPVDFSSDDTIKTLAQLNTAASKYFSTMNPGCDKPSVELDVDLMQLSDSSEYEKFKALERISLTDTVIVWVKQYDVDVEVKVTEITYNGMLQQVTNIVAGTQSTSLYSDVKKTYKDDISELQKYVNGMENGIRNTIQISADGKNTIFRGYTQPDISISRLNDLWYKQLGSGEVEIWIFDGAYWQPYVTAGLNDAVRAEVEKLLQQADADREEALVNFNKAVTDAESYTNTKSAEFDAKLLVVNTTLDATKATANNSLIRADKAILDAGFAQVDASKAISDSGIALSTANTAKTNAGTALTNSGTAITNASAALTRVGAVEVTTGQLTTNYNTLTQTLTTKADKTIVDGIKGTVDSHSVDIETNATAITLKANTTTVNTLTSTVNTHTTQIKTTSDGLALKADSTTVNILTGLVNTHTTQIKATSDGLELKADSSTVSTLTGTVTTHTGQIAANAQAISLRLTSAQVESAITVKKYVTETVLTATSEGIKGLITEVSTDLSNLSVGGTNLIPNTKTTGNIAEKYGEFSVRYGLAPTSGNTDVYAITTPVLNELEYTASFYAKTTSSSLIGVYCYFYNPNTTTSGKSSTGQTSTGSDGGTLVHVTNEWKRYWVTWKQSSSGVTKSLIIGRVTMGNNVYIAGVKFESGNKDSDWSPAPEDMATLERVVTIEANIDGINATVANKANQSQVTLLAGQLSTKVESAAYNTKMTQLDSAINLRVVQSDVTAAILADKTIKDTRNDNQLPNWYLANYPKQVVEELKLRSVMGVPLPGSAYGQLTTNVTWSDTGTGGFVQTFRASDGVFQRSSNAATNTWGTWDKVAETGKLISQINISTEGILLQGKRIQLDGEVAMNSAFITRLDTQTLTAVTANIASIRTQILVADVITSTHLKSDIALINKIFATDANVTTLTAKTAFVNSIKAVEISATKITSGTLNAALLTVLNINVSSLVGNTSDFVLSKWNAANTSISITASGLISVSGTLSTSLNAGSLTTKNGVKTGVVNAEGMEISDSSNGWTTRLYSDGLEFRWYGIYRGITQTSEGLDIKPTTGSGSRLNSALSLTTGPGDDKIAYLQLSNPDGNANSRLEMNRLQLSLRHPNGGSLDIADYAYNGQLGRINSGKFQTTTTDGRGMEMAVSQLRALAGNQTIYIMPTGTGELRIGNGSANPTLWPIRAASFVQGSSRSSKTNIADYRGDALKTLSELKIVTYNRRDELERGIVYESIGVIAEDSNSIRAYEPPNTNTPAGIDNYKMVSLAVKGIQELDRRTHNDVAWLQVRVSSLEIQVIALTKKIEQMESAA